MAKSDPIENALNAIGELRNESSPERLTKELRTYLKNRSNLVVAKAAKVTGEQQLRALLPDLVTAFERFMKDAPKLDKRCAATTEIVTALYEMDYLEPEVYLRSTDHVQKEASFGPPVDAAAALRGISVQGLLRTPYPQAMEKAVQLLVDPEPPARVGAVRALATNGGTTGGLLLRLKVLTGDKEPEVLAECFSGLLAADPEHSLDLVASYVDDPLETTAEAAIWALGQSRAPAAAAMLKEKWERTPDRSLRKTLISAMAASRLPEAIDFLCSQLKSANLQTANDIIVALAPYASSESITRPLRAAVEERGQQTVTETFRREFGR